MKTMEKSWSRLPEELKGVAQFEGEHGGLGLRRLQVPAPPRRRRRPRRRKKKRLPGARRRRPLADSEPPSLRSGGGWEGSVLDAL